MNEDSRKNKILVCVDTSYWLYYTIYGAIAEFQKKCPREASIWIKDPELVDQSSLPDLTLCEEFRRILKKFVMKRCETIDFHLRGHFQDQIDTCDGIDILFAMDDYARNSFRKELYPEYKANRKVAKRSYNVYKIQRHVLDVIFKDLEVEEKYGYHLLQVPGAEGDDVIAVTFKRLGPEYMLNVLIASDRDFLQLEGVEQLNLFGQKVEAKFAGEVLEPKDYLLGKILVGDGSDNIKKVFSNVGEKRALALVRDKSALNEKLLEDSAASERYVLNEKLISFEMIPKSLEDKIAEAVSIKLYDNEVLNKHISFKDFMTL